jgi:hypothetical protein
VTVCTVIKLLCVEDSEFQRSGQHQKYTVRDVEYLLYEQVETLEGRNVLARLFLDVLGSRQGLESICLHEGIDFLDLLFRVIELLSRLRLTC